MLFPVQNKTTGPNEAAYTSSISSSCRPPPPPSLRGSHLSLLSLSPSVPPLARARSPSFRAGSSAPGRVLLAVPSLSPLPSRLSSLVVLPALEAPAPSPAPKASERGARVGRARSREGRGAALAQTPSHGATPHHLPPLPRSTSPFQPLLDRTCLLSHPCPSPPVPAELKSHTPFLSVQGRRAWNEGC